MKPIVGDVRDAKHCRGAGEHRSSVQHHHFGEALPTSSAYSGLPIGNIRTGDNCEIVQGLVGSAKAAPVSVGAS